MSDTIKLDEYCNVKRAKWLLDNIDEVEIREFKDPTYEPKANIIKYCKDVLKSNNGYLKRVYTNIDGKGRRFLKNNQIGYQNMLREYRSILCCEDFYDIDIRNCQPTILEQYCKQNDISCPKLSHYNSNRDAIFKLMNGHLEKEDVKLQFIKMMYGGKFNKKINEIYKIKSFYDEVQIIIDKVAKLNPLWVEHAKSNKKKNINGSVCSYVCQEIEDKLVMCARDFFKKRNYEISALCFDGLMIRKTHSITPTILTQLNSYCYSRTQYKIEFLIKPFEQVVEIDPIDLNYSTDRYVAENDIDGAKHLINLLNKKIICSQDRYFIKIYENANIYIEDVTVNNKRTKKVLLNFIMNQNIQVNQSNGICKDYSRNIKGAKNLYESIISNLEDDDDFLDKVWYSNLKKLCFIDGYYDFKSESFKKYDDKTFTTTYVKSRYNSEINDEAIKKVYDVILNPIFGNNEQTVKYILNWFSRAMAGHYEEKTWACGLGNRNSGKGIITRLFKNTFNDYIFDSFNAEEMCCSRTSNGDIAKKLSWCVPLQFKRLVFSNELKTNDDLNRNLKLDGNIVKSISSGGDEKTARLNYKDAISFKIQCRMCLFMNEMIEVTPNDATETLNIFEFPTIFKNILTDNDKKVNALNLPFSYKIANADLNELINTDEIKQAFIHIILNAYTKQPLPKPNEITENLDEYHDDSHSDDKKFNEMFEITMNPNDLVTIAEYNAIIIKSKLNKSKCKMICNRRGVTDYQLNSKRYKKGLKVVNTDNDGE